MTGNWLSPFSAPPQPKTPVSAPVPVPEPTPEAPVERPAPRRTVVEPMEASRQPLAAQIASYLKQELADTPNLQMAKDMGVTCNTVVRMLSGVGLKLSTLERIATVQGWTVEIKNASGEPFARY